MAIYFDQLNYPKAPIDRYFHPEHFGILFALFGLMVQKLLNFKVHILFLLIVFIPGINRNVFTRGGGLAREADQWAGCHGGKPRRPEAHWQV